MKQQGATALAERQVAQFIESEQIDMYQAVGRTALFAVELFLLECIHQFDR